ncbi:Hypothetical protein CINCED_3A001515 [Cinara cedri]|uniref:Uncharacterized protein n=1 Tax=Cinara cedri TaxID=506608 RepID=A0A5E4NNZ6_9HEMI|nr:Hypothetical protein CINCED_3A001515 [Cinara cedri]
MWDNNYNAFLVNERQASCCYFNETSSTSLVCLLRENELVNCDRLFGYPADLNLIFNDCSPELCDKLLIGSLANFSIEDIIKLPTNLIYFLPKNKLDILSGTHLASLLIANEDDSIIAKKILQSVVTNQQRIQFLNFLVTKIIKNDKILEFISETVYKWNFNVKDGKFQKLSNICGYALARLWAPYILTSSKPIKIRLLTLLTEAEQKQNHRAFCNIYKQSNWKNLPKSVRRSWSMLLINQSYPSALNKWTVEQIAQYKFLLPDFNNNELIRLIPYNELSKMILSNIEFDYPQARFLFSWLMENSTLKDLKLLYPTFFFKLSPLQINEFEPEEWAAEKVSISSLKNNYLSYAAAKQIFNKIASYWLSSKLNFVNEWTSEDLRHLPLLYTQPATSFLKFCSTPPSIQSLIAVDSYMLTDRQAFYLSGCSSMFSFHKNDPKLLLGLKYFIKAIPVSSFLNVDIGYINHQVLSHLVSSVNDHNLPMAFHIFNITNPVKRTYFIEEMLKNKHNILFEQLAPSDISDPIVDVLKQLYSNYTNRIDNLPKYLLNVIIENDELLFKWTGNGSTFIKGLYNGYTCNFIQKINSVDFMVFISNYNAYLKLNKKVFPKNLQVCVAKAFIDYLKLKSRFTINYSTPLYLEGWEIEAVQGFILTTLPLDVILNSILRDNILYTIGRLSFPELMIASEPNKLSSMVDQYITCILKNESSLSYEHLYTLGNLIHFIPTMYLSVIDEQSFKFLIESSLFDTRICVDSLSKDKWANLIIKAFGNLENWSSDTLVTLSDLLIVLNQGQLDSIPKISRLNSADIIQTRYADEIEWLSNNIPFYKGCELFLGDRFVDFTNSLSVLINFHLTSIQNQLQMISPINNNHLYKEIIKSSEAKPKMFKPSVLIPVPEFNYVLNILASPNKLLNKFFAGKEKEDKNNSVNTKKNIEVLTTQTTSITTESISILEVKNSTNSSFTTPILISSKYNESSTTSLENDQYTENSLDVTFIPLAGTINNYNTILNTKNNGNYKMLLNENDKFNTNVPTYNQEITTPIPQITKKFEYIKHNLTYSLLNLKNEKIMHDIQNYTYYSISSNNSLLSKKKENITLNDNQSERKKRSFELFFNSTLQIGCEALKILGPASVISTRFNSIVHSMSNEELENCIDLLGSFDIDSELSRYIWSKIKNKIALHTFGSVLSGLNIDDIKTIELDVNSPWSLELIDLLSKHIKMNKIRKEITNQFMRKSRADMPLHLWSSFGSLICQLEPRMYKIIMPNKELFWKTCSAFNNIKTYDKPCIRNLASIAVSVIGQPNLWTTTEVEHMGIIICGINITQWQVLLQFNSKALEGLSPNTIKCLNNQQIMLMNDSHMKHLTPKSSQTLMEIHSNLLDFQTSEVLLKLVHFEIKMDWKLTSVVVKSKTVQGNKQLRDNNSNIDSTIYAYESTNNISSNYMQAISIATTETPFYNMLYFSILSTVFLLFIVG